MKPQSHRSSFRKPYTTAAERHRWVERFQRSGLSAEAFASEHSLNVWTLRGWVVKTKCQSPPTELPAVREVNLDLPALLRGNSPGPWMAEVQLGSGILVRLGPGMEASQTESLLRAIQNVC